MPDQQKIHRRTSSSREVGFAIAMLGFGLVLIIALFYFGRRAPGQSFDLEGPELFAEEIGHGFQSIGLIFMGLAIAIVLGGIATRLGSNAGRALMTLGSLSALSLIGLFVAHVVFTR
ncbi:hypothetical protein [Rhodopirellula islandica]|nr:hypothetical protein [Rhodopirellula islandica]